MTSTIRAIDIKLPIFYRLLNAVGGALQSIGFIYPKLDVSRILEAATKEAGLDDFGDDSFMEGLNVFVRSLEEEADLSTLGRLQVRGYIKLLLVNRLKVTEAIKKFPEIEQQEIKKPIFIVGLPRTGSTILHNLMAQDPDSRTPLTWETDAPCPPNDGPDNRIEQSAKRIKSLNRLLPGFQAIHPVGEHLAEECDTLMAMNFHSTRLAMYPTPSYEEWARESDPLKTYQFHKQCLQLLQFYNPGKQWLLKHPFHVRALEALLAVYPDARIIQTHRDPSEVVSSMLGLGCAFYTLVSRSNTLIKPDRAMKDRIFNHIEKDLSTGIKVREKMKGSENQFYDLHFDEFVKNPIAHLKKIYEYFDIELTEETESKMREFLDDNSREKHGKHQHSPEMYGLDRSELLERFGEYCQAYGVLRSENAAH